MSTFPSRREFLAWSAATLTPLAQGAPGTHQASGVKVGEVTAESAVIWTRRTKEAIRRASGAMPLANTTKARVLPLGTDPGTLEGSCPGDAGEVRVLVRTAGGKRIHESKWTAVGPDADFSHAFEVAKLQPSTAYAYTVETRASGKIDGSLTGTFRTAPARDARETVEFAMLSCQKYSQRDGAHGFHLYDSIRKQSPQFLLSVGDNVYYDSDDPKVNHVSIARHHWHRMYSLPSIAGCLQSAPGYWLKDDHDSYSDDCYPGYVNETMRPFSFEQGLEIFPEQVPFGAKPYRRFTWGGAVEIFLLEGRDYRSPNPSPDGEGKSIWGAEQKRWLMDGVAGSKAQWKIIVSPTPLVGPDRKSKHDNHSNDVFAHEGREFRQWLRDNTHGDTFWLNGDRHWQYHSVDPETGTQEFGCGAASDSHASGTPGEDPRLHRFHRVKGGYLWVSARNAGGKAMLTVEHRDVHGARVYGQDFEKKA
ncbi:MAG: alkaline phosphatase D family protein [Bryobacteraceae bacterium]